MKYLTECSDLGQGQYDHFGLVVLVPVVCVCVFFWWEGGEILGVGEDRSEMGGKELGTCTDIRYIHVKSVF